MGALDGKVAVITGGSRGLGLDIARAYVREGARVVIGSRDAAAVASAVESLREIASGVEGVVCDVADLEQVKRLRDRALSAFGQLDIWVNNAGLAGVYGPTAEIPIASFEQVLRTNMFGVYYGSVVAMRYFESTGQGKLINMLGRGDRDIVKFQNAYAPTKAWVRTFTLALAKEYAGSGIGVYACNPGLMNTDLLRHVSSLRGYEQRLRPLETVLRLWGEDPAVPSRRLVWLASSATDGRTGLEVQVLSRTRIVAGVLRELARRLLRRPAPDTSLHVSVVEPETWARSAVAAARAEEQP